MVDTKRQIIIHSDYAEGDTEGPHRDARAGDVLVSPDKVRVYDGVPMDGYLELSHDGIQAKIESSLGTVSVDGVTVAAHISRHLASGADSTYVVSGREPLPSDDGYAVGMRWLDTVGGQEYVCFSNAPATAVWHLDLTEERHRILRQLIHFIDNGPASGFASGAYREMTGTVFPTAIVWYDQVGAGKKKIVSKEITWNGAFPATITWKVYDTSEVLLATVVDILTYSGPFEISRTRSIA